MRHLLQYALFVIQLLLHFPLFLQLRFVCLSPKSLMVLVEELTVVVFLVLEGRFVPCQRLLEDRVLPCGVILQHPPVLCWSHVVAVKKRLEWTHVRLSCPRIQQRVRIDRAPGSLMCFGDWPNLCSGGWTLLPTIAQVILQVILQLSTQRGPMLLNDVARYKREVIILLMLLDQPRQLLSVEAILHHFGVDLILMLLQCLTPVGVVFLLHVLQLLDMLEKFLILLLLDVPFHPLGVLVVSHLLHVCCHHSLLRECIRGHSLAEAYDICGVDCLLELTVANVAHSFVLVLVLLGIRICHMKTQRLR